MRSTDLKDGCSRPLVLLELYSSISAQHLTDLGECEDLQFINVIKFKLERNHALLWVYRCLRLLRRKWNNMDIKTYGKQPMHMNIWYGTRGCLLIFLCTTILHVIICCKYRSGKREIPLILELHWHLPKQDLRQPTTCLKDTPKSHMGSSFRTHKNSKSFAFSELEYSEVTMQCDMHWWIII